jgi:chromate reductase, NAD(P)H dehydrogenase (quinone)
MGPLLKLQLPIYDGDWEAEHGLPEGARRLKTLLSEHDALLVATPEHNGGYTALLKNALGWASRPSERDPSGLGCFTGKLAAMVSASPGLLGAIRSQIALQVVLHKLGIHIVPASFALGSAHQAFEGEGGLKDSNADKAVRSVGIALAQAAIRHAGSQAA